MEKHTAGNKGKGGKRKIHKEFFAERLRSAKSGEEFCRDKS
jgi:hypothetical protein